MYKARKKFMENKTQIEFLQEKKKKLQEAQKNNTFYLDDYQKKLMKFGNYVATI